MKTESISLDYGELCQLYDGMMESLNNLYCSDFEGLEAEVIKGHYLAAKLMTLMLQTRPISNIEDPF